MSSRLLIVASMLLLSVCAAIRAGAVGRSPDGGEEPGDDNEIARSVQAGAARPPARTEREEHERNP